MADNAGPYAIGSDHWPGLSKLLEESGEVQQVIGKLIAINGAPQHWDGSNLHERLACELGDLLAAIEFVIAANDLDREAVQAQLVLKLTTFVRWHQEQGGGR